MKKSFKVWQVLCPGYRPLFPTRKAARQHVKDYPFVDCSRPMRIVVDAQHLCDRVNATGITIN